MENKSLSTPNSSESKNNAPPLEMVLNELNTTQTDIRQQINGKWRDAIGQNCYFSANFNDETFLIKWYVDNPFTKYTIGVKHWDRLTTSVEDDRIVQKSFTNQGEEFRRFEFYIDKEKEQLQIVVFCHGNERERYTYERIGDLDSE